MRTLLLLVGVCSALPQYPTHQKQTQCVSNQRCVPPSQCAGVDINNNGTGTLFSIINIKASCSHQGICCDIPVPPLTTCPDNEVCTGRDQCDADGNVITDGSGLTDDRNGIVRKCHLKQTKDLGICCNPPSPIDSTPITPTYPVADKCGVSNLVPAFDPTIHSDVASNEAKFGEFPWQAMILKPDNTFVCGASLVGNKYVLTAAHYVNGRNPSDIKVRFGDLDANIANEPKSHVEVNVTAITIHPDFNPKNVHNDIAVIQLVKSLDFQDHINTICLPSPGQTFPPGQRCIASGWGKTPLTDRYQYILKKIELPTVGHLQCQTLLRKTRLGKWFWLDKSFMCAGGEEYKDTCVGDGGGPLACLDLQTGRYVLTGITAWHAAPCGTKYVPGVYADVQALLPFVDDVVNGNNIPSSYN